MTPQYRPVVAVTFAGTAAISGWAALNRTDSGTAGALDGVSLRYGAATAQFVAFQLEYVR